MKHITHKLAVTRLCTLVLFYFVLIGFNSGMEPWFNLEVGHTAGMTILNLNLCIN